MSTGLRRRRGRKGGRVFLFGHSLGAALALGEAVRDDVAGVATLGAFTRMTDMAPSLVRFAMSDRYDNLALLPRIRVPVHLVHGTIDDIVPFAHAERLIAASNENARLSPLEAVDHHADMGRVAATVLRGWKPN